MNAHCVEVATCRVMTGHVRHVIYRHGDNLTGYAHGELAAENERAARRRLFPDCKSLFDSELYARAADDEVAVVDRQLVVPPTT